ncbi:hypothetical protein [Aurantiacibacter rhizosphaerae]|uniref:Uncharacterized protein n=1 Tax=Aurantiacibacter rhizosphaerae TaxID=2691582 RepID=A0A844XB89_9SPHN|nr:hypothetical protein [Aurantiacibacter rhizosphaerae]MWV26888.1 hypothetical protein [Aurantiacibacter rhizosphaerae]
MTIGSPNDSVKKFEEETARFREVLAKGRSAKQIELFDFLVEHSDDDRSPKEIEVAVALLGNQAALESSSDSGIRVYVHRLRKRLEDHYDGATGPRLAIPKGEYRVILEDSDTPYKATSIAKAFLANPALGSGLMLFAFAAMIFMAWLYWPTSQDPVRGNHADRQGILGTAAGLFDPVIAVGDNLLLAETEDQRSIQRMVLAPDIQTRDELSIFLQEHPEAFYQYYDFNLRFASIAALETAWNVQGRLLANLGSGDGEAELLPVSALEPELLRTRDVVFVGRLSQLGPLNTIVFSDSNLQLAAFNRLDNLTTGASYTAQVYTEGQSKAGTDYGYLSVRDAPNGRRLILFAGLGDRGSAAMAEMLNQPAEIAALREKLDGARKFEAVFEVQSPVGQPLSRRLVAAYPLP